MKIKIFLMFMMLLASTSFVFSQATMTMKNGDEVKVKVIEILPDQVKYKKADNLDGPTYTELKSNIFMIKYQNGSKDVFAQSNSPAVSPVSPDDEKKTQAVEKLHAVFSNGMPALDLIEFKKTNGVMRDVYGQPVYEIEFELTVQFKNDGYKKGNGLVGYWQSFYVYPQKPDLNASNEAYIYDTKFYPAGSIVVLRGSANMEGSDNGYQFKSYKISTVTDAGIKQQNGVSNSSTNASNGNSSNGGFEGHYNFIYPDGDYKIVKNTVFYKSNLATITSISFGGINNDSQPGDIKVGGNKILSTFFDIVGFTRVGGRYSFSYSVCATFENGAEFEKKENMDSYNLNDPCIFQFDYNTPSLKNGTSSKVLYMNVLIKDKNSDAKIQGYYKFTLVR